MADQTSTSTSTSTDPRVRRSRERIIPAAISRFAEHGYSSVNMDEIADAAGVSKRTIYNLYEGKEELFRAALEEAFSTAEVFASEVVEPLGSENLNDELQGAAKELARIVTSPQVMSLRRLVIGEAHRFPDLAAEYWRRAPGKTLEVLATRFGELGRQGVLAIDDGAMAAQHFAYLTVGVAIDRSLFHPVARPDAAEIERAARAGVDAFLRAYQADRTQP